jgi:solute carrier family 41
LLLQVVLLLYMCQVLIYWMWSRGTDPDNAAIPYLTAVSIIRVSLYTALTH